MKNLDTLINELCPDGVEFVKLEEVLGYEQPTKYIVKCKEYQEYSGAKRLFGHRRLYYGCAGNQPIRWLK